MPAGDVWLPRGRDHAGMPGVPCRIVVKGDVSERLEQAFGGLTFGRQAGYTELTGTLADQCQLRSLLNWLFDLGMEVTSLQIEGQCDQPGGLPVPA